MLIHRPLTRGSHTCIHVSISEASILLRSLALIELFLQLQKHMRSSYNPAYTGTPTKRYFITNELHNWYPEGFVVSERHKYVHVVKITLVQTLTDGSLYYPKNIVLHADFVQDGDCFGLLHLFL